MKRMLSMLVCAAALTQIAAAQTLFRASLDGSQEVPPNNSTATAWSTFVLNPDSTLTYFVNNQGLSAVAAHIHEGPPGVSGPIIFPLSGGPDIYSGTTPALTPTEVTKLRTNQYYVNVHTAAFSNGEIRGQIGPSPINYGARLIGDEETPPVVTSATGDATFSVNPDNSITYLVTTTGLTGTAAHIHTGGVGVSGPITFPLSGGPTVWSGTTAPMMVVDFNNLQSLGLYVNVHTGANPNGEIRGQIVRSFEAYGKGCPTSVGIPVLSGTGATAPGGNITIGISGGKPSSSALLLASFTADCSRTSGCGYYLGVPALIVSLPLNGTGSISISTTLPDIPSFDFFLQAVNLDAGAPNGQFGTTNGLHMPFTNY
jgi:hypothetical protein